MIMHVAVLSCLEVIHKLVFGSIENSHCYESTRFYFYVTLQSFCKHVKASVNDAHIILFTIFT